MENQESRRLFLQKLSLGLGAPSLSLAAFGGQSETKIVSFEGKKLNIARCGLGRYAGYMAEGLETSQYCRLAGIVTGTPSKAEK